MVNPKVSKILFKGITDKVAKVSKQMLIKIVLVSGAHTSSNHSSTGNEL